MDTKAMTLLQKAKKLDEEISDFISEVYAISGMKRPDIENAALFALSEMWELLAEVFGKHDPLSMMQQAPSAIADYHASLHGGWKRTNPATVDEKCKRAEKALSARDIALRLLYEKSGKTCTSRIGDVHRDTVPYGNPRNVAKEAGQLAMMAVQAVVSGEDESGQLPGPFEAVAQWAIELGERAQ